MFIKATKGQFYEQLLHNQHVLVLCHMDVDALATTKILSYLLKCDSISFSLSRVAGLRDLQTAVYENSDQIKRMVFINCGANINLIEVLQPPEDVIFFVIDNHRPFDLDNIYDSKQIRLVIKDGEETDLDYPEYEQIYKEDSDDSDNNASDEEEEKSNGSNSDDDDSFDSPVKKRQNRQKRLVKKAEKYETKQNWITNRGDLLWQYYENSYISNSSAMIMFDVAHSVSKATTELLWYSFVGFSSHFLEGKMNSDQYTSEFLEYRVLVNRMGNSANQGTGGNDTTNAVKIKYEKDLHLPFYKHWSLLDSIYHSTNTVCHFHLWSQLGTKKLHRFLAELGLPLRECKQKFSGMNSELRKGIVQCFEEKLENWKLKDLILFTFSVSFSFTHCFTAADYFYSVVALLEMADEENDGEKFHKALNSLSISKVSHIYEGMNVYKRFLDVVIREITAVLNQGLVETSGTFLLLCFSPGNPDLRYFLQPSALLMFGRFLLRAFLANSNPRGRDRHSGKPLIMAVPMLANDEGWFLVAGIPPLAVQTDSARPKNLLGRAFERVAEQSKCRVHQDSFDTSIIRVKSEDRGRFFDCLSSLLI